MRFVVTRDPEQFADKVRPFLAARLERNVAATVLENAVAGAYSESRVFAYGLDDADDVVHASLRTPPWYMLTSELDPANAGALLEAWLAEDPDLPGVDGPASAARAVSAAWTALSGGTAELRMSETMHSLAEVIDPPRPAPGALRPAGPADREQLIVWEREFVQEAGLLGGDRAVEMVDRRLANGLAYVWENGAPVSTLGVNRPIAGVVRIGPVYTPPQHRRRGYAGTAVAAVSRLALGRGARACMLLTDDTNPTSNKIYAEVGFRPFASWEEYAFAG